MIYSCMNIHINDFFEKSEKNKKMLVCPSIGSSSEILTLYAYYIPEIQPALYFLEGSRIFCRV
jgi:hypothetical protein